MSASRFSVVGRIRPKTSQETHLEDVVIGDENAVCVKPARYYKLDKVFGPESSQVELFDHSAKNVITEVLKGCNGTIFTYGQTGSGKTFTMKGEISDELQMGLIPNSLKFIFHELEHSKDENSEVKVSYLEIYNNKIFDLLSDNEENKNIKIYEDNSQRHLVLGIKTVTVKDFDSFLKFYSFGESKRHFLATGFNENSSRSHCILQISIKKCNPETEEILTCKLNLVDLAGSEKVSKVSIKQSGKNESVQINKSLSHLAIVIYALACNNKHIPYRNCILTRLLKEGLDGNSFTSIIICLSPTSKEESIRSLEFGHRAKFIKNKVVINKKVSPESWKRKYEKTKEKLNIFKGWFQDLVYEVQKRRKDDSAQVESFDENFNVSFLLDSLTCDTSIINSSDCDASTSCEVNNSLSLEAIENDELSKAIDNFKQQVQEQLEAKEEAERFIEKTKSDLRLLKEELVEERQKLAIAAGKQQSLSIALQKKEEEFQTLKKNSLMEQVIHELKIKTLIRNEKYKEMKVRNEAERIIKETKYNLELARNELADERQKLMFAIENHQMLFISLLTKQQELEKTTHKFDFMARMIMWQRNREILEAKEMIKILWRKLNCSQMQLEDIKTSFAEKEQKLSSAIKKLKYDVKELLFE